MTLKEFCGTKMFGVLIIFTIFIPIIMCCESGDEYSEEKKIRFPESRANCLKFCYEKGGLYTHDYWKGGSCTCKNGAYSEGHVHKEYNSDL